MSDVQTAIRQLFRESAHTKDVFLAEQARALEQAIDLVVAALAADRKILLFGNGGSAADAQHIAAELVGRFTGDRRALPAIALTTDTSALTAIANDYGYDQVFARQVQALGRKDDVAIAISTSGRSPSVLRAVEVARDLGMRTIGLTGGDGGRLAGMTDIGLRVSASTHSARIQETHILVGHVICELVDRKLFGLTRPFREAPPSPARRAPAPLDPSRVRTIPLGRRPSKVDERLLGAPVRSGLTMRAFLRGLPDILGAHDLREAADRIATAIRRRKPVVLGMGAHPIKVGLGPLIVDLLERGRLAAVAMNGACLVHDFELAWGGRTSEDVGPGLDRGDFGMARETGEFLNRATSEGVARGLGLGRAVGDAILRARLPYRRTSILAACARLDVPATIHVAVGTDIIHMHPSADGAAIGEGSLRDFRLLAAVVGRLDGGVYLNLGSAVIMPEVFVKALNLARNLGRPVRRITTVDMDFIRHYRPGVNVVARPTATGGTGIRLTGHHEIMFPLLWTAVEEALR